MEPRDVTYFDRPEAFRAWLSANADSADELWVGYWRKSSSRASLTWEESVDEALCFGWIDGIRKRVDEEAYTIRFTPRRPRSIWSNRNIERYQALTTAGRITPAGEAAWARRREERSGVYSFEQSGATGLSPEYLRRLDANPEASAFWSASPAGYRRRASHWVMSAKREETRDRRLATLIADCAAGLRVKPLRR